MNAKYTLLDGNGNPENVTEADWLKYVGDKEHMGYASQLYSKEITIEEVPKSMRAEVQRIADAKVERWGEYIPKASDTEIADAVEGIL